MKERHFFVLVAIMLTTCSLQGMSFVPESSKKSIKAVLEFYPNYAGHLLGVAQIGYKSQYAEKYLESVKPTDLKYLKDHGDLLRWSDGDEGVLSYFFLTFPGYINPASKDQLADYLTDLNSAIAQKSFDTFKNKYEYYIEELELWTGFNENQSLFNYSEEIQTISKILMNNYDSFKEDVWPNETIQIQILADALNDRLQEWNLINRWENITGLKFDSPNYQVVLSMGMENGPTAKALGYDKDWYFYGDDPRWLVQNICEEAGFRILSKLCSDQYDNYDPRLCFEVYKTLSNFITDQILADLNIQHPSSLLKKDTSELYGIIDALWTMNSDRDINELYGNAIETFSKSDFAVNFE